MLQYDTESVHTTEEKGHSQRQNARGKLVVGKFC